MTDETDTDRPGLSSYLRDCRALVVERIHGFIDGVSPLAEGGAPLRRELYDLMLDYPLRDAKGLRPAVCIATCRALGGPLDAVVPSAAVLELYHNAFLIHDDIEDESELRRDRATLHRAHGVPVAINVGDAMLALALRPLLDNMRIVGMGKALRILRVVADMARESAEGQAIELDWVHRTAEPPSDAEYLAMAEKKTSWYSFIAPLLIGGLVAEAPEPCLEELRRFGRLLGVAFQIQDDLLNLEAGADDRYGKEGSGDLWEGKRTLILLHALREAGPDDRARALAVLAKRRPLPSPATRPTVGLGHLLDELVASGELAASGRARIAAELAAGRGAARDAADVSFLAGLVARTGSLEHARRIAVARAVEAAGALDRLGTWMRDSVHRDVLAGLVDFVVERRW